jgi:hypothetical protein
MKAFLGYSLPKTKPPDTVMIVILLRPHFEF